MRIRFEVRAGDALEFRCDVLAIKYAQASYGLDKAVLERLQIRAPGVENRLPKPGAFEIFAATSDMGAANILMIGVDPLPWFEYQEIREFGRRVIAALGEHGSAVRHVAVTIHGAGYGLDESESFTSELSGILDAIKAGGFPNQLALITFVERNDSRAARLDALLQHLLSGKQVEVAAPGDRDGGGGVSSEKLDTAGADSATKPHVFVAMPFDEAMDDTFHYGIQRAAHAAGYLCERADEAAFTGDVMQWVTSRIRTAKLVIADLTNANPNVYLEVGFALGSNVPVVLLNRKDDPVGFDLRGQRRLIYTSIRSLEDMLTNELKRL